MLTPPHTNGDNKTQTSRSAPSSESHISYVTTQTRTSLFKQERTRKVMFVATWVIFIFIVLLFMPIPYYNSKNPQCQVATNCLYKGWGIGPSILQMFFPASISQQLQSPPIKAAATPDLTANWKMYENAQYNFRFKYPLEIRKISSPTKSNLILLRNEIIEDPIFDLCGIKNAIVTVEMTPQFDAPNTTKWPPIKLSVAQDALEPNVSINEWLLTNCQGEWVFYASPQKTVVVDGYEALLLSGGSKTTPHYGFTQLALVKKEDYIFLVQSQDNLQPQCVLGEECPDYQTNQLFNQILSTFEFIDNKTIAGKKVENQIPQDAYCQSDADCGVNICDCKAQNSNYIKDEDKICMRVCSGTPVCFKNRCIFKGNEDKYYLEIDNVPEISWNEAMVLINGCQVVSVTQSHALGVMLTLRDRTMKYALEPEIDDVLHAARAVNDTCGPIQMATE